MKIVFDLDGTLIDSQHVMTRAWSDACQQFNLDIKFTAYKQYIGLPFNIILNKLGVHDSDLISKLEDVYSNQSIKYSDSIHFFSGILDVINNIDCELGLVTSKPRNRTNMLIDNIKTKFKVVICCEDTPKGKPNPDPILKAMEVLGNNIIYIGDTKYDYLAAVAAGVKYFHVDWGIGACPEGAHKIHTPLEIYEVYRNYTM